MAKASRKSEAEVIQMSVDLNMREIEFHVLGLTPFICNSMAEKAMRSLLFPAGRKNAAERATSLKHEPIEEYRSSPYRSTDPKSPTLIQCVAISFKRAMESIALDVPGLTKAQLSRNLVAPEQRVSLYGAPQMLMSVVRSADMARTPDVRTRAILPEWACKVRIRYPHPMFRGEDISKLFALSGLARGVGDFRPERGAGSYGQFEVVEKNDSRWKSIVQHGGRAAQMAALESPEMYDDETEKLFAWFVEERQRRGPEVTERKSKTKRNGSAQAELADDAA